jgi:hypothetical protein
LNIRKWLKRFWFARRGAEDIIHTHDISESSGISETETYVDVGLRIWVVQIVDKTIYLSRKAGLEVKELAAPHLLQVEDAQVKSCDNTKLVATTFQGSPKIFVAFGIGVYDLSTG